MNILKQAKKGALAVEYAIVLVSVLAVITPALLLLHKNIDYLPFCDNDREHNICALFASTEQGEAGDQASSGTNVIGNPNYNANPDSPYVGAWVFGAGQMLSFEEKKLILPRELFSDRAHLFPMSQIDYRYLLDYGHTIHVLDYLMNSSDPRNSQTGGFHDWFIENRMLELDDRIKCGELADQYGRNLDFCQVTVTMPVEAIIDRSPNIRMQAIMSPNDQELVETIDYGAFYLDSKGEPLNILLHSRQETHDLSYSRYASKIMFIAGDDVSLNSMFLPTDLTVDGAGNVVSLSFIQAYLELSNGFFEAGSGIQNANPGGRWSQLGGRYLYKPGPNAVVAGYLDARYGLTYTYDRMDQYVITNHLIDLRESPDWSIKSCEFRNVTFQRQLEHPGGYETTRTYSGGPDGSYGPSGPRSGMAVIMENPAGETFELIHVDRQSFPGDCSTDNPHLFLQ